MLQKFVFWTGASDFLVGAGTMYGAIMIAMADIPVQDQFVPLMTLGMFLMMAAACLMWASQDMVNRYPVMVWQGLVRLMAISATIYAIPNELAPTWQYGLLLIDGPIGLTYIIGAQRVTGHSLIDLVLCKPVTQTAA